MAVLALHIVELLRKRLENVGEVGSADARMLGDHRRVAVCRRLYDLHIAALERRRRGCLMLEEEVRMPRIIGDGEILRFLHVDIARICCRCAARELRDVARNKPCRRAVVLVVPDGAVLQVEVYLALFAGKKRARELGVRRRQGKARERLIALLGIFAMGQDVALDLDLVRAERAVFRHIDEDARTLARVADSAMLGVAALCLMDGQPIELGYT